MLQPGEMAAVDFCQKRPGWTDGLSNRGNVDWPIHGKWGIEKTVNPFIYPAFHRPNGNRRLIRRKVREFSLTQHLQLSFTGELSEVPEFCGIAFRGEGFQFVRKQRGQLVIALMESI